MSEWLALLAPAFTLGAVLVALSAPLGCLVVYKNMAFFADTLAHGALLGIAIAAISGWPLWFGMVLVALLLVAMLTLINNTSLPTDALLAAFSAACLSLGLIIITHQDDLRASVMGFLFGDLLGITWRMVIWSVPLCLAGLLLVYSMWRAQIRIIVNAEIAQAEGVHLRIQKLMLMLLVAGFSILALQAVGSLLVSALLVLPALTARLYSQSPKQMLWLALLLGELGLVVGIGASVAFDVASGLAIVLVLVSVFFIGLVANKQLAKRTQA